MLAAVNADWATEEAVPASTLSYDIAAAAQRQAVFFYQVSLPHYQDPQFLKTALERCAATLLSILLSFHVNFCLELGVCCAHREEWLDTHQDQGLSYSKGIYKWSHPPFGGGSHLAKMETAEVCVCLRGALCCGSVHSLLHRTTCCTVPRWHCTRFCAALAAAQ